MFIKHLVKLSSRHVDCILYCCCSYCHGFVCKCTLVGASVLKAINKNFELWTMSLFLPPNWGFLCKISLDSVTFCPALHDSPKESGTLTKVRVSRHMIYFILCCAQSHCFLLCHNLCLCTKLDVILVSNKLFSSSSLSIIIISINIIPIIIHRNHIITNMIIIIIMIINIIVIIVASIIIIIIIITLSTLLFRFFRLMAQKSLKLFITGLLWRESTGTDIFPHKDQ